MFVMHDLSYHDVLDLSNQPALFSDKKCRRNQPDHLQMYNAEEMIGGQFGECYSSLYGFLVFC